MFHPAPILGHRLPGAAVEGLAVRVECEKKILGKLLFSRAIENILEAQRKEFDPVPRLKNQVYESNGTNHHPRNKQVRKYVIRREVQPKGEGKKPYTKAPKIQRLVTPQRLQHKRHRLALKRRQAEKVKDEAVSYFPINKIQSILSVILTNFPKQNEYAQILAKRVAEAKAHKADARKRRASSMHK